MGLFTNQVKKMGEEEVAELLLNGETAERIFSVGADFCAVTNYRVIVIDKNIMSKKKAITAAPFSRVSSVSLKRGGSLSNTKEIIIQIGSREIELELYNKKEALEIFHLISEKLIH